MIVNEVLLREGTVHRAECVNTLFRLAFGPDRRLRPDPAILPGDKGRRDRPMRPEEKTPSGAAGTGIPGFCRDCGRPLPHSVGIAERRCPSCRSTRLLRHPELDS